MAATGAIPWFMTHKRDRFTSAALRRIFYMVSYTMIWHGMVWHGMVWYVMVSYPLDAINLRGLLIGPLCNG